ncbi:hypothetical protein BCV69DRAFT_306735 [Microstroma glucosiphilum]|uniref:Uncharacterized protein n=1 Tax=Pseudomicrostroma glucosiphilum TaxID=1684307 RepID=A0A316UDS1_9BASI|nr:hypothetical protein BCV69DRAFT_306735 [Pseudomicrostroma glucosiphilum]PWN22523.1 hypothetical protein BCV69DRAFT_306735 [Pseudomicrostroma glucosiphilum]
MNPASSSVRAFRPLLAHAASSARSSTTPRIATFATSSYLRRPPQPTAPVREAAEPAVVKSPSQPPNPASWPGRQKESSPTSQSAWHGQQSGPTPAAPQVESIPHAESSKAAQERAAKLSTEGRTQQQQQPSKTQSVSAGQSASTSASEGSCATLSPSSPAGPRSQTAVAQGKAKESSTPKAAPPEEAPAKGAAATSPSPPSTSAAKPATSGKAFRAKKAALSLVSGEAERRSVYKPSR